VRATIWLLILFGCFSSVPALAQTRSTPPPPSSSDRSDPGEGPTNGVDASTRLIRDMAKKANQERAAAVKTDTEKLLKLAEELKVSVDKSGENVLSLDVIKKAEEIEKLAHSVKDKMKGPN
jgi:hypothetical protein